MPIPRAATTPCQRHLWLLTAASGVAILGTAFFVAWLLCLDATGLANTVPDPAHGRIRGAYTMVESWLGFHRPSLLIRVGELALALTIVSGALYRVAKRFADLRRAGDL